MESVELIISSVVWKYLFKTELKEGEAFRGILYPKYLEMETFFLTLEHILRLQKKKFFGSDPHVETSGGNFLIFEALFWASLGQPVDVLEF